MWLQRAHSAQSVLGALWWTGYSGTERLVDWLYVALRMNKQRNWVWNRVRRTLRCTKVWECLFRQVRTITYSFMRRTSTTTVLPRNAALCVCSSLLCFLLSSLFECVFVAAAAVSLYCLHISVLAGDDLFSFFVIEFL